jgi:hypothetical protein
VTTAWRATPAVSAFDSGLVEYGSWARGLPPLADGQAAAEPAIVSVSASSSAVNQP